MSGSESRNRPILVGVRLSPAEARTLRAAAKRRGMTVNTFMRTTALAVAPIAQR